MSDDFWNGIGATIGVFFLIVVVLLLFNINRPRVMDYPADNQTCVVRMGTIEDCWRTPTATPKP